MVSRGMVVEPLVQATCVRSSGTPSIVDHSPATEHGHGALRSIFLLRNDANGFYLWLRREAHRTPTALQWKLASALRNGTTAFDRSMVLLCSRRR